MDKIEKFLKKLTQKERTRLSQIIKHVRSNNLTGLDIKKIKDQAGLFRVRIGDLRVVFYKENNFTEIISINRRNKSTYKK